LQGLSSQASGQGNSKETGFLFADHQFRTQEQVVLPEPKAVLEELQRFLARILDPCLFEAGRGMLEELRELSHGCRPVARKNQPTDCGIRPP
jgi:hypothetical protein